MSTVIQYKNNQKLSQHALVESKTKNLLLTSSTAIDIVGHADLQKR